MISALRYMNIHLSDLYTIIKTAVNYVRLPTRDYV